MWFLSVCRPLQIIYKSCLDKGKFPQEWKKANVVPVHKKNDKQLVENYRHISLLPMYGKIFERILYNSLFDFLNQNDLFIQLSLASSWVTLVLINCYQ